MFFFSGYRPDYNCKSVNATELIYNHYKSASNLSDIYVKYGKCEIDINANGTEYKFSQSCPNGYEYDIPTDRSTVTEVCRSFYMYFYIYLYHCKKKEDTLVWMLKMS